jgi:ATP-dependent helicase HrpB
MPLVPLPIDAVRPRLTELWARGRNFVLTAPTGSGKSTRVPAMLADLAAAGGGQILVLQPRRVAARWLARRVAAERGCRLGEEVGYQIRHETRAGPATRILFVTEGILLRRLQADPRLRGVAAILFDEFHERHLQGDLGLAVARLVQRSESPDLRLGVMSATLATATLADFLSPAVEIAAEGRTFPVEVAFSRASELDRRSPIWVQAAEAFRREARRGFAGDCLIFMPGAFEIRKTLEALGGLPEARGYDHHMLHGEQSPEAQDAVFARGDRPKIIVSTNVAETSLTLPEVRLVIDSGQARIAGYDPRRGINTLLIEPISQASAEQRAGRAGRVAPGRCLRLWTEAEHAHRARYLAPEIERLDLSESLLALHATEAWHDPAFAWFEPPPEGRLAEAEALLAELGALRRDGRLSPRGELMAELPLHPRLAALLLEADALGCPEEGCLLAALLEGRPLFERTADRAVEKAREALLAAAETAGSDHLALLFAWQAAAGHDFDPRWARAHGLHAGAARQAGQTARQLQALLQRLERPRVPTAALTPEALEQILLAGFADHVARRLNPRNYAVETARGRRGEVDRHSLARDAPWVLGTDLQERTVGREVLVVLGQCSPVHPERLRARFPGDFHQRRTTRFDERGRRVITVEETTFRALVLASKELPEPDAEQAAALLADKVLGGELVLKHWNERVAQWIERVNFLARACPDFGFSPFTDEDRRLVIEQLCFGESSYAGIKDKSVQSALDDWLPAGLAGEVHRLAPIELELGERKRFRVRYPADGPPIVSGQLQRFYDVPHAALALAGGRVRPRVELLAPNQRPAQLTDDLDAFWTGSYAAVKKDLRGRYPRHEWR